MQALNPTNNIDHSTACARALINALQFIHETIQPEDRKVMMTTITDLMNILDDQLAVIEAASNNIRRANLKVVS